MRAVKIGIGAEIQIIVFIPVEYGINGLYRWNGDGARRKTGVSVRVIGRVVLKVAFQDAGDAWFNIPVCIDDGWTSL